MEKEVKDAFIILRVPTSLKEGVKAVGRRLGFGDLSKYVISLLEDATKETKKTKK